MDEEVAASAGPAQPAKLAFKSASKPANQMIKDLVKSETVMRAVIGACGMSTSKVTPTTYQEENVSDGTKYYIKLDIEAQREKVVQRNKELVLLKPKGNKPVQVVKNPCGSK